MIKHYNYNIKNKDIPNSQNFFCKIYTSRRNTMFIHSLALLPLILGKFSVKAFEVAGVKSYRKHTSAADKNSWSYSDADSGDKGVCSAAKKCGPATWSKVNVN